MRRPSNGIARRTSSAIHYQTFPTPPPKSKGQPPSDNSRTSSNNGPHLAQTSSKGSNHEESPLPIRQLVVLAIISLSEQTALNSIGPYLPQMVATFKDVDTGKVGLYVGLVASSFALAQFATNFLWGWLSDRIGRKPVVLTGTLLTAACFVAFGFCKTLWQAIIVQVFMGLGNGNQGIVSTCLGEITDRSNQSRAFIYLPVIYGLGGITGPVVGGLLVSKNAHFSKEDPYPYMKPNLVSAAVLIGDMIMTMIFLEESLEEARELPPLGKRVGNIFTWVWQFASSSRPSYLRIPSIKHKRPSHTDGDATNEEEYEEGSDSESVSHTSIPDMIPRHTTELTHSQIFNRDTLLLMSTYLIFQLSNISYNSLYPIFGQAAPPRGRRLSPKEIGFSLAFASAATIVFQLGFFGRLREKLGNRVTYRICMAAMALAFILTPWVGYKDSKRGVGGISSGKVWLWIELGFVLLIKSLAAVGCLTSFLLLITNSAPNHSVLGTLNGLAQTLSAAGRAVGPFFAGGLFSLGRHVEPKGEAVAFGVFGGIAFVGFLMTFGIRGANLESEGWDEEEGSEDDDEEEDHARKHLEHHKQLSMEDIVINGPPVGEFYGCHEPEDHKFVWPRTIKTSRVHEQSPLEKTCCKDDYNFTNIIKHDNIGGLQQVKANVRPQGLVSVLSTTQASVHSATLKTSVSTPHGSSSTEMIYLPPLRRFLLPAIVFATLIISYRALPIPTSLPSFVLHAAPPPPQRIHVPISALQSPLPIANSSHNHLSPPNQYYYSYHKNEKAVSGDTGTSKPWHPELDPNLESLFKCPIKANRYTSHVRLPDIVQNISQIPPGSLKPESRVFWNPTVIALPYWSENQYLIVSRIVTDGNHQENVLCEANVCHIGSGERARRGEKPCTEDDLRHVGPGGGMRCASSPVTLSVPPTPAERCEGKFMPYVDIPGFHDPRIFWSGKGEPLMMVNTQSRYACFGLWIIDLRTLHSPLRKLLTSSPLRPSLGPLMSYPTLTELTRNPADTRSQIEKNWFLFFPSNGESYIHYDLSDPRGGPRGRTFAKLLGNGLTTTNLTDPYEQPCLRDLTAAEEPDKMKRGGTWHQATNSLRLILCNRFDYDCKSKPENMVFFAIVHRKFPNWLKLPLRYERYFMVWSATPPFEMLGISRHPVLMSNETASGWSASENWDDDPANTKVVNMTKATDANASEPYGGKDYWAYFTYTVSISYAWGREPRTDKDGGDEAQDMNVGYLDDEVLLAIGVDDKGQAFSRAKAGSLVQCLRACAGRIEVGLEKAE